MTIMLPSVVQVDRAIMIINGGTFNSAKGDLHINDRDPESGMHDFRSVQKCILIDDQVKDSILRVLFIRGYEVTLNFPASPVIARDHFHALFAQYYSLRSCHLTPGKFFNAFFIYILLIIIYC